MKGMSEDASRAGKSFGATTGFVSFYRSLIDRLQGEC